MTQKLCIDVTSNIQNSLQNYIVEFSTRINFCPVIDKLVLRLEDGAGKQEMMVVDPRRWKICAS